MEYKEILLSEPDMEAFARFGRILAEPSDKPTYSDAGFSWWNELETVSIGEEVSFGIVQPKSRSEFEQSVFECHTQTPEILIPLDGDVIAVLGRRGDFESLDLAQDVCAFRIPRGMVVILYPGVWHYAPITMNGSVNVLVAFRRGTSENDTVKQDLKLYGKGIRVSTEGLRLEGGMVE